MLGWFVTQKYVTDKPPHQVSLCPWQVKEELGLKPQTSTPGSFYEFPAWGLKAHERWLNSRKQFCDANGYHALPVRILTMTIIKTIIICIEFLL